jgi:hypothetical protein
MFMPDVRDFEQPANRAFSTINAGLGGRERELSLQGA